MTRFSDVLKLRIKTAPFISTFYQSVWGTYHGLRILRYIVFIFDGFRLGFLDQSIFSSAWAKTAYAADHGNSQHTCQSFHWHTSEDIRLVEACHTFSFEVRRISSKVIQIELHMIFFQIGIFKEKTIQ